MESQKPISLSELNTNNDSSLSNDTTSVSQEVQPVETLTISENVEQVVETVKENVEQVVETVAEKVEEVVEQATEKVEEVVEQATEKVEEVVEQITEKVEEVVETVAEKVEEVVEQITEKVEEVVEQITDKVEEIIEQITEKPVEQENKRRSSEKNTSTHLHDKEQKELIEHVKQTIENQKHKANDTFNAVSKKVFDKLLSKHDSLKIANAYDLIIMIMEIIEEIYLLDKHDVNKKIILIEVLERISKGTDGISGTEDDLISKNTVDVIKKILENRLVEGIINTIVRASKGLININKKKCKSWFCCFK